MTAPDKRNRAISAVQLAMSCLACFTVAAPAQAQSSAPVTIFSRVGDGAWLARPAVSAETGQAVSLKVEPIEGASIRWYQLIPDVTQMYKNANFPWDPDPYKWVGFTRIRYAREELTRLRGRWEADLFRKGERGTLQSWTAAYTTPFVRSGYYHPDIGSFWFQAEVEKDGKVRISPGLKDSDYRGLSPKVLRVSLGEGAGLLRYLTTFFNVPALFGSVPYQSNNYIGADCADTLIAARGKWTGVETSVNYNVARLVQENQHIAEFDLSGGRPGKEVRWGDTVLPGDLIAVRFPGARMYQHIGALSSDADNDGVLSSADLVIHAGPNPLAWSRLSEGPFDGHISVMRFKLADIKDKPISFSEKRKEATREYILKHYGSQSSGIEIEPRMIVIHWTGTSTLESAWKAFNSETLPQDRQEIASGGSVNVSAHFLVGRDGSIYRLMPETWMARHVIGLNLSAIGIENVGGVGDAVDLTDAQLAANARLVRYLRSSYPGIDLLIGHHEYLRFAGHPLWLEKDPQYRTRKSDPGPGFMSRLRKAVSDLELKGPP